MSIFKKGVKLPRQAKFQEIHFLNQLEKILWSNEKVLISEFVKDGNDPLSSSNGLFAKSKQRETENLAGHPYYYLASSMWRCFIGFPASGKLSSYAYGDSKNEITVFDDENGRNISIAQQFDNSKHYRNFIISNSLSSMVESNLKNPIPIPMDKTRFIEYQEDWDAGAQHAGHKLIAAMNAKASGSESARVKECESCGYRVFSPDKYPVDFFKFCRDCLRQAE